MTDPNDPKRKLDPDSSEADFLSMQAEQAKAAMGRAMTELKGMLAGGADPRLWARQYPWATLGASAVAGFVAATLLVPSKEEQALKKLAAIERALTPAPPRKAASEAVEGQSTEAGYKSGRHSFLTAMLGEVIGAIKPAVISLLTAGVTATAAKPSQAEMQAAAAAEDQSQAAGPGTPPD